MTAQLTLNSFKVLFGTLSLATDSIRVALQCSLDEFASSDVQRRIRALPVNVSVTHEGSAPVAPAATQITIHLLKNEMADKPSRVLAIDHYDAETVRKHFSASRVEICDSSSRTLTPGMYYAGYYYDGILGDRVLMIDADKYSLFATIDNAGLCE